MFTSENYIITIFLRLENYKLGIKFNQGARWTKVHVYLPYGEVISFYVYNDVIKYCYPSECAVNLLEIHFPYLSQQAFESRCIFLSDAIIDHICKSSLVEWCFMQVVP